MTAAEHEALQRIRSAVAAREAAEREERAAVLAAIDAGVPKSYAAQAWGKERQTVYRLLESEGRKP